jgi:hypothetical protein
MSRELSPKQPRQEDQKYHRRLAYLERRAKERGLSVEEYLNGIAQGKYPQPTHEDTEAERLD